MKLYSVGDRVSQAQYGDGTVSSANEYHVRIDFDLHGLRTFASSRVSLERTTTLAPIKVVSKRKRVARNSA
jgi:hypothetical protein